MICGDCLQFVIPVELGDKRRRPWERSAAFLLSDSVERLQKRLEVAAETLVRQFDGISFRQVDQIGRKLISLWHCRTSDEGRNDADVAIQCVSDLNPDEVLRIVQASPANIGGLQPVRTNESDEHIALADGAVDFLVEIHSGLNGVDIHEYAVTSKSLHQGIGKAACICRCVLAPVADEDAKGLRVSLV